MSPGAADDDADAAEWRSGMAHLIGEAERQAACGFADRPGLYKVRVQGAYAVILAMAPVSERKWTRAELDAKGFDPSWVPYPSRDGNCALTGLAEAQCSCGRHW